MSPKALTGPEIDEVWSDEIGYDVSFSERAAIQRLIAARDAQWAAMIGEPVAWLLDGSNHVEVDVQSYHTGEEWTSLYAIKEPK